MNQPKLKRLFVAWVKILNSYYIGNYTLIFSDPPIVKVLPFLIACL